MNALVLLLGAILATVEAGTGGVGGARPLSASIRNAAEPHIVDFVVDIPSNDDVQISDVMEDEDEEAHDSSSSVLCIAPPCGLKMKAVPTESAPVPWIHRLVGPEII